MKNVDYYTSYIVDMMIGNPDFFPIVRSVSKKWMGKEMELSDRDIKILIKNELSESCGISKHIEYMMKNNPFYMSKFISEDLFEAVMREHIFFIYTDCKELLYKSDLI